ncbi:MAG TPA: hypothetical protein VGN13_05500 [Solirubrobacteraceae bacterium]
MASSATISRADLFPATTKVKVFALPVPTTGELLKNNSGNPENWKPALTKLGEPEVTSGGVLEVSGIGAQGCLLWAEVGGHDVYLVARGQGAGGVTATSPRKVKVKTTSTQLLAANPNRTGLSIENIGPTNVIYLGLGAAAVLQDDLGPISVNGSWDGRVSGVLWTGSVFGIAETAEVTASVLEI